MKRYFVFAGLDYYPRGGMGDFVGDFDSSDEAQRVAETAITEDRALEQDVRADWAQIYDTAERRTVWKRG